MSSYIDFLTGLGFGEIINNASSIEDSDRYDIESYGDLYKQNISILKDEFDDNFIIEMFICYNTVFMRDDFGEMLKQVSEHFNTDLWSTLIAYEWNETGKSSVFELMDSLEIGYFESNLADVCVKVRSIWVNDYGDDEL